MSGWDEFWASLLIATILLGLVAVGVWTLVSLT